MTVNNLFPPLQSAYRKNHSTETALLKITNEILLNMNKQHVTLLVVLDLSAAFDTTDQDILLDRMSTKLGIEGVVLKWFGSYLKGRSQRDAVHGAVSENELYVIKNHLPNVHCFADDSELYLSFNPSKEHGDVQAAKSMELCVNDIKNRMSKDKLLMNDDKTEFLIIGLELEKVNLNCISIGTVDILLRTWPCGWIGIYLWMLILHEHAQLPSIICILLLTFRAIHSSSPQYIDLITVKQPGLQNYH
ncbi:Hypothetical predicted protein [Paramuricea clavata]|uniref:Uncharacterized protein n=1 Tax=Paramuricea clavata TaxID=317549 RepID=A0A7D9JTH6_PARCT|nr:Hypothetical predicted protein [Paramuricea clavata]